MQTVNHKYCPNCGRENRDTVAACATCGLKFNWFFVWHVLILLVRLSRNWILYTVLSVGISLLGTVIATSDVVTIRFLAPGTGVRFMYLGVIQGCAVGIFGGLPLAITAAVVGRRRWIALAIAAIAIILSLAPFWLSGLIYHYYVVHHGLIEEP